MGVVLILDISSMVQVRVKKKVQTTCYWRREEEKRGNRKPRIRRVNGSRASGERDLPGMRRSPDLGITTD